jgi:Protein of unknown function (DUF3551)
MRYLLAVLGLLAAFSSTGSTPARAQNYPWCEYLGGGMGGGGGRNCGFISYEQCMESARGNGSDCRRNTQYEPPPGDHPPAVPGKRKAPKNY